MQPSIDEPVGAPRRGAAPSWAVIAAVLAVVLAVGGGAAYFALRPHHDQTSSSGSTGPSAQSNANGNSGAVGDGSSGDDSQPSDTSSASPSEDDDNTALIDQQAQAVDDLLQRSGAQRANLQAGISLVSSCSDVPAGRRKIASATRGRAASARTAQSLDLSALDSTGQLKTTLVQALQASQKADAAFQRWARRAPSSCSSIVSESGGNWSAGKRYSTRATNLKQDFVQLWNPIAEANGLGTLSEGDV